MNKPINTCKGCARRDEFIRQLAERIDELERKDFNRNPQKDAEIKSRNWKAAYLDKK